MVDSRVLKAGDVARDFFTFQTEKSIISLFKRFLEINENLKAAHDEMLAKVKPHLTKEQYDILIAADYFTNERFRLNRKTVFDCGNSCLQEILTNIEKFEIYFNSNK